MVSWSWSGIRLGLGVDSGSLVGHISDISVISVGDVLDVLDPAIGKSHGVSTLDIAGTIGGLLGVEVGLGVVISHGVGEGVGRNLIGVGLGLVGGGGMVSGGWGISGSSLHNNGGNDGGSVNGMSDNRGSMVDHGVDGVVKGGSMVDGMMSNWVDSMVSNWVDSVVDWSMDGMSKMRGVRGVRGKHDSSVADVSVAAHIRGGGGSSQTEQGGNDESLK